TLSGAAATVDGVDLDNALTGVTVTASTGLAVSGTGHSRELAGIDASTSVKGVASFNSNEFSVSTGAVSVKADGIDDTHLDFGTGATQINTADVPELTNLYYTDGRVDTRLDTAQTISGDWQFSNALVLATEPTLDTHATTKLYVDNAIAGLSWKEAIIDKDLTSPPGLPVEGNRYLISSGATGAWVDKDNNYARYHSNDWVYEAPETGDAVFAEDEKVAYTYNGTTWVQFTGAGAYTWGTGLTNTGTTINVAAGNGITANADTIEVKLNATASGLAVDANGLAVADALAGNGLAITNKVMAVGVDDSTIEINTDAIRVKDSGITSAKIADSTIANLDIATNAAIAGTKISPDFGSQNILTSGTVDGRDLSVDGTKLDGIEALADITDATNVTAAGAVMDGDFSTNGLMKRTGAGAYAIVADSSSNWNTAYTWGDHSAQNYLDLDTYPNADTDSTNDFLTGDTLTGLIRSTTAGTSYVTGGKLGIGLTVPTADLMVKGRIDTATAGTLTVTNNSTSVTTSADLTSHFAAGDAIKISNSAPVEASTYTISTINTNTITLAAAYTGTTDSDGSVTALKDSDLFSVKDGNNVAMLTLDNSGNLIVEGTINATIEGTSSNANLLDNIDSSAFLRSDVSDSVTTGATLNIDSGATLSIDGAWNIGGTTITPDAAEINILDGGLSSAELDSSLLTATEGDTSYVNVSGDTMTGKLTLSPASGDALVTTAGNVGIGTTAPAANLNVKGNLNTALTGTVSVTAGQSSVTGTGTLFATELVVGDAIKIGSQTFTVSNISDNTHLTLSANHTAGASGATSYKDSNIFLVQNGYGVSKFTINKSGAVSVIGDFSATGDVALGDASADTITIHGTVIGASPALLVNQSTADTIADFQDSGTSVFYIADGGNVGIGTTSPTAALSVGSTEAFKVTSAGAVTSTGITLSSGNITLSGAAATVDGVDLDNALTGVTVTASTGLAVSGTGHSRELAGIDAST
ncbi:MAG: DUF2793 domain-containing protein, partial [Dehalococcoidales bacterium]|nr:DUF2793 domain-containing protein [Dehalococcoidales bacterium]